jgi:ADP-heptose:LPS heptosyltransferase
VLTTPALEILKNSRPDLRIGVVVEPRFAGVFEDNPDVDATLEPSVAAIRRWRPVWCLNLHGGTRSMMLTASSGARYRAGFAHHSGSAAYNVRIPTAQEILQVDRKVHTAEHLASAMFYLGARRVDIPRARLFTERRSSGRAYAVLHPVAATVEKTWPAERFIAVASHLEQVHGLEPVFIAGPGEDLSPFSRFRTVAGAPLSETKPLLAGASIFVGNDSGPAHMAAALGIPVVVLFGPSDPVVWAPWRVDSQVLTGSGRIESITVDDVIRAAVNLRVAQ